MDRKIDFFKKVGGRKVPFLQIATIAVCIAILGGLAFYGASLYGKTWSQEKDIASYNAYSTKQDIVESYTELREKQDKTAEMRGFTTLSDAAGKLRESGAAFDGNMYNYIVGYLPDGVTIADIVYANGTVTVNCTCADPSGASEYVRELDKSGAFEKVEYDGFKESGTGFAFSVICRGKQ